MANDYLEFVHEVKRKTGIDLTLYKEAQMKRRLTSLYEKKGFNNFHQFSQAINNDKLLMNEFLDRMTINVSEFYRNYRRWEVLQKKIIPRLLLEKKSLKVWSAACSTGEESYSLAMVLSDFLPLSEISITASDIDENAIQRAKIALYPERSLNELPDSKRKKYFTKEGSMFALSKDIQKAVSFKKQNLLADKFEQNYDLIVCRNVLIYFTEEAKNNLYKKFNDALRPGGVLFVGSTEQIFHPDQFNFETEDTFFYRKK